ncbi:MAG: hypothetical protein V7L22_19055 [Nostoc sp.]|uniref:hypothetical protein n=1 Tax=Nostoc sp. TaxID=1180 RepID=UPI002FF5F069
MKNMKFTKAFSLLLMTSTVMSLSTLSSANALSNLSSSLETPIVSQKQIISVAPNWKSKFPNVRSAMIGELEAHLQKFARGNKGKASVDVLEVRGIKLYIKATIRHHHVWKKPWGGNVTVYSLTNTIETSFDPLNPTATLDKTRLCFNLAPKIGGGKVCVSAGDIVSVVALL